MTIETEKNQGKVEWFNTGTIGHVDHGKTSLTAAIATYSGKYGRGKVRTYESIDKAPEERARGITINSTIIDYYGPSGRRYSHTDCPGHADYVKNMITGSSQMDGAILVVAATDGAMPQTKEHLLLAKQIGVKQIIVYLNKMDIANLEMTELVIEEIKELLEKFEFDRDCPVIKGSAAAALTELTKNLPETEIGAKSIGKLIETMDSYFHTPERSVDKPFYAFIEGVYSSPGRGTVCTGKIEQGTIKAG